MRKGEQTRALIVERAAQVFSRQGYAGTSLVDLMRATGLEKGGIYNHFANKDDLALAAFDHAFGLISQRIEQLVQGQSHAVDRLQAFVAAFASQVAQPSLPGGCPVLNTAVEADDTHPALLARARHAADRWFDFVRQTVVDGIARGEVRPTIDPEELASVLVAALEGAIMLSQLYRDPAHMQRVVRHLTAYVETIRL